MDGCGGLLIVLVAILFLTGTINGLVVLVRLFARAVEAPSQPVPAKQCVECGGRRFRPDGHCADCGASQTAKDGGESDAIVWESAKRELRRLHNRGLLPRNRLDEMLHVLAAERDNELLRESVEAVEPAEVEGVGVGCPEFNFPSEVDRTPETSRGKLNSGHPTPSIAEEPLEITSFAEAVELESLAAAPAGSRIRENSGVNQADSRILTNSATSAAAERPEKRDWGKLLQAFMEEKNIRWGELLSGMLIVGSAIGLVISLWSTLQKSIPYFPALLFMLATAAIHGAGLYTLRRWKLQSTSRGLLLISTLLIPLNFLAAIALSTTDAGMEQRPITDPLYLAAVCIGSVCYGLIALSSGRVFRKGYWWALWLAVMVPSLSQLVIARLAAPDLTTEFVNFLAALATAGFLAAMVVQLQLAANGRHFPKRRADQTFQMLGIGLFSLLMAFGLLLSKTGNVLETLAAISPVVSVVAVLLTSAGLIVHHRAESAALATTRTAGTAVTLTGASFMLASLSFAWPKPELLIAVGLVDVVALTAMAFSARLPALHLPAIAAAALTALTSLHWWQDNIHTGGDSHRLLIDALLMGRSSLLLLGVAGLCLLLSTRWKKMDLAEDARYYLLGAAGLAGVGVLVAYYAGFISGRDAEWTTPVFALAAVGFLLAGRIVRQPWVAVGGAAVLFTAFYHLVRFNPPVAQWLSDRELLPVMPFVLSALLTATVTAVWAFVDVRSDRLQPVDVRSDRLQPVKGPAEAGHYEPAALCGIALFASGITLPRLLSVEADQLAAHSGYLFWFAGLWGLAAATMRHRFAMIGAQVVSLPAVAFAAAAFVQTLGSWDGDFGDPRHWQIQVGTLAVWCLLWTLARWIAVGRRAAAALLGAGEPNLDHAVVGGLVVVIAGLCMAGALPGLAAEFRYIPGISENPRDVTSADSLAMLELVGLAIAVAFAAAVATSKRLAVPAIIGGAAAAMFVLVIFPTLAARAVAPGDPTHAAQFGPSLWIVLGLVTAGVAATFWERVSTAAVCGLVLLGALVPLLIAAHFAEAPTAATVLRWGLAAYAVVAFAALARRTVFQTVRQAGRPTGHPDAQSPSNASQSHGRLEKPSYGEAATSTAIVVTVFPLLAFTLFTTTFLFNSASLPIAAADVWVGFRSLGWSNAAPLWVLAALCLALAARERKPAFAIAASLFIQLGVTLLFVLPLWQSGTGLSGPAFAELIQWNAVGLGVCTLLWMAPPVGQAFQPDRTAVQLQSDQNHPVRLESLTYSAFGVQLALTTVVTAGLSLWAAVAIIASPDQLAPLVAQLGDWKSFVAFALAATAIALSHPRDFGKSLGCDPRRIDGLAVSLLMVVPLLAAAAGRLEIADAWRTYHVLTAGWTIGLLALTAFAWRLEVGGRRSEHPSSFNFHPSSLLTWALAFATVVVFLGLRAQWGDPQRPSWLVGTAAAAALCTAAFGLVRRSQPLAYLSTGLVLLATTAALSHPWIGLAAPPTGITYQTVVFWNLIALSLAGLVWLFVDVVRSGLGSGVQNSIFRAQSQVTEHSQRKIEFWTPDPLQLDPRLEIIPLHHTAAGIGLLLAGMFAVVLLFLRAEASPEVVEQLLPMASPLGWGVVAGVAALLLASLWDRRATHAVPGLYVMGLIASLTALDAFDLSLRNVWLGIGGIAAAYTLATGMLWWQRGRLSQLGRRLGLPEEQRTNAATGAWLPVANVGLAALAIVVHFWVVLTFADDRLRLGAGLATALLVPAFACLAQEKRGVAFRFLTLTAAVVAALQVVWSFSPAELTEAVWLERMIRLLEVASVATLLYALGSLKLLKPASDWGSSLRNVAVATGGLALAALLLVLTMEATLFPPKQVPITTPQIVVVSVILVGLAAGLIVLAVLPGRDPLRLSERGRMLYVYAAEVVASLLFLHIYLTKPALFHGYLRPYWEFIVLGIAFAGAGLGEWFQRRKLAVLAEPLQRTGAFLPLLPAIAFWADPRLFDRYSTILFIAGLLYVVLAMWRQSFRYAVAAAFVGNMALWVLFYHHGYDFVKRPQLWLIPPALSVLVAGQLNRNRLSEAQLAALRYICVTLIYVSSTGEMFISGAGRSWLHPMVLATLAVIGVLAGMLMRVRAFLYLGSSFLFLSIVSMVWHAAQAIDRVWPWWVFGLVMGVVLLVFFGVFEKKRNEVLRVFGRLKEWER